MRAPAARVEFGALAVPEPDLDQLPAGAAAGAVVAADDHLVAVVVDRGVEMGDGSSGMSVTSLPSRSVTMTWSGSRPQIM